MALSVQLELVATHDESTIPGLAIPGYMAFDSRGVAFGPDGRLVVDHGRVQVFDAQHNLVGVWAADPGADKLAALALSGDHLWVEAPYTKLFELEVSWTS